MFTSKLNFSFLPNFPLGPWPFFSQVLLHVSQTANGIFMPSSLSLGFNGNKKHFLLLVILNNATTFAASKHERAIYFLLIPCPLKMTSGYFFGIFPRGDRGNTAAQFFQKQTGKSLHSLSNLEELCLPTCLSPAGLRQWKLLMILYLNRCFVFPSSLLLDEFLFFQFCHHHPPKHRWTRFSVFQYIDRYLYDWHCLLQSVSTEGATE